MQIPWPYVVVMCMVKLEAFAVGWDKERFFIGFLSRLGIISYEPCPKHCFVFLPQLHVPSYCPRQMYECACIHQHESFYKLLLAHEPYYAGLFKTVGQPTMHQHVILNESWRQNGGQKTWCEQNKNIGNLKAAFYLSRKVVFRFFFDRYLAPVHFLS